MKHLGNLLAFLIAPINLLFTVCLLLSAYSSYIQPAKHPVESCMGLAFPIFLAINVAFLVWWLVIRRYKIALLPLVGLLLCAPQIRSSFPVNFHMDTLPEDCLKVLSYNVMGFDGAEKPEGGNPILNYLARSEADVLCLQEYNVYSRPRYLLQEDVDKALAAYPYHSINTVGTGRAIHNRNACYSKYPILSAKPIGYPSEYNGSVAYELLIGNDTVLLINNHLESNKLTKADKATYEEMLKAPEKNKVRSGARLLIRKLAEASVLRAMQADSVAHVIATSKRKHVIVCGDFNDTALSYAYRVIGDGLNDAFVRSGRGAGISYNQHRFYFRIDHILHSSNLKSYRCTVDRSIKNSDHYPIWCYLKKKD